MKELKGGSGEQMTREEMHAREMMLPRGNNKNVLKVNISKEDDQEDINAKMQLARQKSKAETSRPEAMEAEEPVQSLRKPATQTSGKRIETVREKKLNHKPSAKDLHGLRGKEVRMGEGKQPLNVKNVPRRVD